MRDGRNEVTRRRVFYIPGFDPFPARRYRELYRREAALQGEWSGHRIDVLPSTLSTSEGAGWGWRVEAEVEGRAVVSEVTVLGWSDIVRASIRPGILSAYWQLARTLWIMLASGALPRLLRLRKGPAIAALYPAVVLLAGLAIAVVAGVLAYRLAAGGLRDLAPEPAPFIALAAGLLVAAGLLAALRLLDRRTYAFYLLHDYAYATGNRGAYPAGQSRRIDEFARAVALAFEGPWDEVLIVGHSTGAQLAVTTLARVLRRVDRRPDGPELSLLTLGHAIPMVGFLPGADELRGDLRFLSTRDDLTWVDVTAPGDGCSYALCDPVAVCGVASEGKRWPLVLSAAFSQTLSPERYRALRRRFFRLHFQYLCAFDRPGVGPGAYDYFAVTAGPRTLAARFAGRAPSPSRIGTPLSGYRSVA
jgi:hypothetical protein